MGFFIGLFIGCGFGLFIAALMRANDTVETCPKCQGVENVAVMLDKQPKLP